MKKRLFSLLLALFMCLSLAFLPEITAWADDDENIETAAEENATEDQLPEAPEESPEPLSEETGEVLETETEDTEVSEEAMLSAEPVEETVTEAAETETYSTESGADNDEMFAGFVNSMFYRTRGGNHDTGNRLEGLDNTVYWLLYNEIVNVSHGNSSSTVFGITFEQMGIVGPYTAEELGVTEIFSEGSLTQEASEALKARRSFDFGKVIDALLADCPYDLYWYDKTASTLLSSNISYSGTSTSVSMSGTFTFSFPVEQEYAADTYQVDTSIPELVQTAVTNAQAIASNYSSYADEAKLSLFKDEICRLVSYNDEAADPSNNTPYGDPWQLIWVFDGDPDSNVVCEGYAKAFQYLCDISSFSGNICCYQISGTMHGGTGAGGHMWNIVKMDSRKNYLVDVTNCDDGTIGWPDLLFLREPVSGSVSDGYTFSCGSSSISYTYDADMFDIYTTRELTLAIVGDIDPVAAIGDTEYETLQEALAASTYGDTIVILQSCEEERVVLRSGRTLDLNGKTLTADYVAGFNGSNLIDSSNNGLLASSNVILNKNNSQMPVKTDEGYKFLTITPSQSIVDQGNPDVLYLRTRPYFMSPAIGHQFFGDGMSDNGISIEARLTYTNSQGSSSNTFFTYNDTHASSVYNGGTPSVRFYVRFTGVSTLQNVKATTIIRSDTGVEFVCPELSFS